MTLLVNVVFVGSPAEFSTLKSAGPGLRHRERCMSACPKSAKHMTLEPPRILFPEIVAQEMAWGSTRPWPMWRARGARSRVQARAPRKNGTWL